MARTTMLVLQDKRTKSAVEVQSLFTEFGCSIRCRLGLHETSTGCVEEGLIFLELASKEVAEELEGKLNALEGVKAKTTTISFCCCCEE